MNRSHGSTLAKSNLKRSYKNPNAPLKAKRFVSTGRTKCNEVSKSLVSGVAFPKQVSRPPYLPKLVRGSIWPSGSPGCRRYAHRLEKQGRDIKEMLVCKRKDSGEVKRKRDGLTLAGSSYRGPFQVDQPAAFNPSSPPSPLRFWVERNTPRWLRLLMRSGIAR
ncbi:hypothetical protein GOODEAATRI_000759 [Goodea atripinnis]|uniref:Uncharacterized protein n=1 Tax=Goodea atripinnis TaxID=208336 RepID=A0ABV0N6S5_9TELE